MTAILGRAHELLAAADHGANDLGVAGCPPGDAKGGRPKNKRGLDWTAGVLLEQWCLLTLR